MRAVGYLVSEFVLPAGLPAAGSDRPSLTAAGRPFEEDR